MTKTVRVPRTFSESSKVTFYTVEEARCRTCGHTFRVVSADDRKYADAELCKVDYYEEGNGHEREGLCAFPDCDEPAQGEYCTEHGAEIARFAEIGKQAVRRVVEAVNRPAVADEWDRADFAKRIGLLVMAGVRVYDVKSSKAAQLPWEAMSLRVRRRLAMQLDNVVI